MSRTTPQTTQAYLPAQFRVDARVDSICIRQLSRPAITLSGLDVRDLAREGVRGQLLVSTDGRRIMLVSGDHSPSGNLAHEVLATPKGEPLLNEQHYERLRSRVRWLHPLPALTDASAPEEFGEACTRVLESWRDQFFFREEEASPSAVTSSGLRPPQIGALHAALAHWKVSDDPATVVMPTGTGKTETMLALLAHQRMQRLLIVVPTRPLRRQTIAKVLTLGLLKPFGVLGSGAAYPVVAEVDCVLPSVAAVDAICGRCQVLVATMPALIRCSDDVKERLAERTTHLFVDEAHHLAAEQWTAFRTFFTKRRILQFTATPFRRDGKRIDGTVIFNYPLGLAQRQGYFRPITLRAIHEYDRDRHDEAIAVAAIQQLRTDEAAGWEHLVLARTSTIERAKKVHALYVRLAPELAPLLVHSRMPRKTTTTALASVRGRSSKVVVCVDMLGEGFDLPELKIAALHDVHKSLAVTLQFTGRFTRGKPRIGDATMVANVADPEVETGLEALYAEDADWNTLLRCLSEGATAREMRRSAVIDSFTNRPTRIRLENVLPKMSTVVYRTSCETWRPRAVAEALPDLLEPPAINPKEQLVACFSREQEPVPWGDVKHLLNTSHELYLLHWDSDRGLLFIHTSNKDARLDGLAKAVAGEDAVLIRGEEVFRTLHGINHFVLMNLGLNHSLSHAVRFTMLIGEDVRDGLSQASLQTKRKSNMFGRGYEGGEKTSIGCSAKGRIWSHQIAYDLAEWLRWCQGIGTKLLDQRINIQDVLDHVIVPSTIDERPPLVPLTIEWSEHIYSVDEDVVSLDIRGESVPLVDVGLELTGHADSGPLQFRVFTERNAIQYEVVFERHGVAYRPVEGREAFVRFRRRSMALSAWLDTEPPIVRFENGAFLIYNNLFPVHREGLSPFAAERIVAVNWSGVDLRKESQGTTRAPDSIQRRLIEYVTRPEHEPRYDIIFDDDNTNEAADVVALKVADERLLIDLFHCKFAKEGRPAALVDDLYAVCGQAQRSVHWKARHVDLLKHLQRRETSRLKRVGVSRFERGDARLLSTITRRARHLTPQMRVAVVQPGLSKAAALDRHLQLLAATEVYLRDTFCVGFDVFASA